MVLERRVLLESPVAWVAAVRCPGGHAWSPEEEVDSVGGLMAMYLGRVPIPGSGVEAHGLHFEAEEPTGRRNRVGTVRITRVGNDFDPARNRATSSDDYQNGGAAEVPSTK